MCDFVDGGTVGCLLSRELPFLLSRLTAWPVKRCISSLCTPTHTGHKDRFGCLGVTAATDLESMVGVVGAWSSGCEAALQSNDREARGWSKRDSWRYLSGLLMCTRSPYWKTIKRSGRTICLENEAGV